jgi:hypothetical protein
VSAFNSMKSLVSASVRKWIWCFLFAAKYPVVFGLKNLLALVSQITKQEVEQHSGHGLQSLGGLSLFDTFDSLVQT